MFRVQVKELISGKISEISIDANHPDQSSKLISSDTALLKELRVQFGLRHIISDSTCPRELMACLGRLSREESPEYSHEVTEGAEILKIPETPLPEGAIP